MELRVHYGISTVTSESGTTKDIAWLSKSPKCQVLSGASPRAHVIIIDVSCFPVPTLPTSAVFHTEGFWEALTGKW